MCLIMEINSYLSCIEDEKIYYQKKALNDFREEDYRLLLDIFYYQEPQNKKESLDSYQVATDNHSLYNLGLDILNNDENYLFSLIKARIYTCDERSNREFCEQNRIYLSGYITYCLQKYNLFLASTILAFLAKFGCKDDFILTQHVDFILNQKTENGRIGYLNPLKSQPNIDLDLFYAVNLYSYKIISKIFSSRI